MSRVPRARVSPAAPPLSPFVPKKNDNNKKKKEPDATPWKQQKKKKSKKNIYISHPLHPFLFFLIVSYKDFSIKLVHSKRINKLVYCFYDLSATGDRHLGQRLQRKVPAAPHPGGLAHPPQLGNGMVLGEKKEIFGNVHDSQQRSPLVWAVTVLQGASRHCTRGLQDKKGWIGGLFGGKKGFFLA